MVVSLRGRYRVAKFADCVQPAQFLGSKGEAYGSGEHLESGKQDADKARLRGPDEIPCNQSISFQRRTRVATHKILTFVESRTVYPTEPSR